MENLDNINPDHYKKETSLECIEAMTIIFGEQAVFNFCLCNAFKYIWRWKHKNGTEDLEKAMWYVDYAEGLDEPAPEIINHRMYSYIKKNLLDND